MSTMQAEDWPWIWALADGSVLDWKRGLSHKEISSQALRQQHLPVEILPGKLYLGNARNVRDVEGLKELGITAVLNMAGPEALVRQEDQETLKQSGIVYKEIYAEDEPSYPLIDKHWQEAYDFVVAHAAENPCDIPQKCVVNCVAGMNRSALVVCAYYMLATRTPVLQTVKHIRHKRGNIALCNEGFQQQLVALARQHNLLGIQPGTAGSIVAEIPPPLEGFLPLEETTKKANPLDRLTG